MHSAYSKGISPRLFDVPSVSQGTDTSSTFADNLSSPIHRWFRFTAGFSATWVRELIEQEKPSGKQHVLDPFAGSGTVLLEGERCGMESIGIEAHPFLARVARAKLCWRESPKVFREYASMVLHEAKSLGGQQEGYPDLIQRCFPPETLSRLDSLHRAWEANADGSPPSELVWLALISIIRDCSPVGTAQWQYVLPNKTKANTIDPFRGFSDKVLIMSADMAKRQKLDHGPPAALHQADARECSSVAEGWADLVITSPPYANNYDYADATRLEMSFLGDVSRWRDLHDAARRHLVCSCTQHAAKLDCTARDILNDPLLSPIQSEIVKVCERLQGEREHHGGRKPYHKMIAAYFRDMAKAWNTLRRVTSEGAKVCFVVGDSAPYGVYVPVDRWLGELSVAADFKSYTFEKTRDRNIKWKNRKHRVPLHEGRLWIRG